MVRKFYLHMYLVGLGYVYVQEVKPWSGFSVASVNSSIEWVL